jgi:hypothetical protein
MIRSKKISQSVAAVAALTAAVAGTTVATATPAAASSWVCNTSSRTIDNPGDAWGNDDWTFKVTNCINRSGSYVTYKSRLVFDAPRYSGPGTFDSARYRVYLMKARSGPDFVQDTRTFNIEYQLEHDADGYGVRYSGKKTVWVGSARHYTDSALLLDWNHDGDGVRYYGFTGSGLH